MLLERLKNTDKMTPIEKKISEYISLHRDQIVHMSVKELADSIRVSKASIVRFCQHLGIKGFREFKVTLLQELSLKNDTSFNVVQKNHVGELTLSEVFFNVLSMDRQAVDELTNTLELKDVKRVVDLISKKIV